MGNVQIVINIKDNMAQMQGKWQNANMAELGLALAHLEIMKDRVMADIKKAAQNSGVTTEKRD